jgi:signal peptide peptidase SppA
MSEVVLAAAVDGAINLAGVRTARIDEYINAVWAIEPRRGLALFEAIRKTDILSHIQATVKPRPSQRTGVEAFQVSVFDDDLLDDPDDEDADASIDVEEAGGVQIAVIDVCGTLMKQASSFGDATSTVMLRKQIRDVAADPRYAGIVLRIDSPGGSVSGTPEAAEEIRKACDSKPVIAFAEDLCASAAYWLASQADEIYCNHGTCEIGSIGTFIGTYDYSGACEKEGILAKCYVTGPLKGTGFPGAKITEEQDKYLQGIVDGTQKYFAEAVASGRGISHSDMAAVSSGGVFLADDVGSKPLHDGIKSFDECLSRMGELVALRRQGQSQTGGLAMAESDKGTQALATAATATARADVKRYVDAFGPKGASWYAEGKSFEDCQTQQLADLRTELAARDVTVAALTKDKADLTARVEELRGAAGPAASGVEAEAGKKAEGAKPNSMESRIGKNIAARAAEIQLPKGK